MNWYKKAQWGETSTMVIDPDSNPKIQILRNIEQNNESEEIDGFLVDKEAARGILSLYRKLDTDGKERFLRLPIPAMIDVVVENTR